MPELPEVEHLRRSLEPALLGATIVRARLLRPDFARVLASDRTPTPHELLEGATLVQLRRHGKHLAILASDGRALDVHLGMSGQVISVPRDDAPLARRTHVHACWTLARDGAPAGTVLFRDPRRFGGLVAVRRAHDLDSAVWVPLGPDALSIRARRLSEAFASSRRAVKCALLDQSVLAGVGNIYADEALFRSGIRPTRRARSLSSEQIVRLACAIRSILRSAIKSGGSTLRDYVDAGGSRGSFQKRHEVYGRAGHPCTQCGSPLRSIVLGQRSSVFCTSCQH